MKLLPYDTFTIQTSDPLPILLEKLAIYIEPQKVIRWQLSQNHAPYQGTLSEAGFEIHRIIHSRNSFLPIIRGRFEPSPSGTLVRITMKLHPFTTGFLIFWFLTWYSFSLPIFLSGAMPTPFALQFLGMPFLLLVIFWGAFWSEANRCRRDLVEMIVENPRQGFRYGSSPQLRSNARNPKVFQVAMVLIGIASLLWSISAKKFFPATQPDLASLQAVSCAQHPSVSPYCKFSVVQTIHGHPAVSALAISADGQTLVSGGEDKAIKVWDLKTGQLRKTLQSDSGKIRAIAIAPDGKTLVSGSADHMVRIWDLTSNKSPRMLTGHPADVNIVVITPDSKTIISGSYSAIKQWDLATGQLKATFPKIGTYETKLGPISVIHDEAEQFNPLDINPNSNTALISDLNVVDLASNQEKKVPTGKVENLFADYFLSAHMSPDGKLAALQYGNNFRKFETRLKVWDLTTGQMKAETSATFGDNSFSNVPLALSRDRIFGSTDRQLRVWNLETAKLEAVLDSGWMSSLVVSPDGKLLAGIAVDPDSQKSQIQVLRRP